MTALKAPCPHGRYDKHPILGDKAISWISANEMMPTSMDFCPGGTLLPPDSLVIVKEDGKWPAGMRYWWDLFETLLAMQRQEDALAAAQPGRET